MYRYLGIDYGDKRIGVAISDEEGKFAFPKGVIENRSAPRSSNENEKQFSYAIGEIEKIISLELRRPVGAVIVGLPQNFNGEDTAQTKKVRIFAEQLKKEIGIEVIFENEILTSSQVDKSGGSTKAMQDASAAALILQGFLDRRRGGV